MNLIVGCAPTASVPDLMMILANAGELAQIVLRRAEKKPLNDINTAAVRSPPAPTHCLPPSAAALVPDTPSPWLLLHVRPRRAARASAWTSRCDCLSLLSLCLALSSSHARPLSLALSSFHSRPLSLSLALSSSHSRPLSLSLSLSLSLLRTSRARRARSRRRQTRSSRSSMRSSLPSLGL
jgi:hypothetical protein